MLTSRFPLGIYYVDAEQETRVVAVKISFLTWVFFRIW